jgi:hypothetical protein
LPDAEPAGSSVEEALFAPPPTDPTPRVPVDAAVWVAVRRSNVFCELYGTPARMRIRPVAPYRMRGENLLERSADAAVFCREP